MLNWQNKLNFRKAANHPLLLRTIYNDEKLKEMAALIMKVNILFLENCSCMFL